MNIYLHLFLTFLEIGAVSFGGGYGMLPLIREKVLSNGWLTEEQLLNMLAVSESTPGPIAVNMATFIGSSQGGVLGSLLATLGVVLPAFIIIITISAILKNLLKYAGVNAFLGGIRPVVAALIVGVAATMFLSTFFNFSTVKDSFKIDLPALAIFAVVAAVGALWKKFKKKKVSPIILILISAALGMAIYSII